MKPIKYKRNYATLYYTDARGGLPVQQGSCKTVEGGKRSVATQVFAFERFRRAEVVDRKTGTLLATIAKTVTGKITIHDTEEVQGREAVNYRWREKAARRR